MRTDQYVYALPRAEVAARLGLQDGQWRSMGTVVHVALHDHRQPNGEAGTRIVASSESYRGLIWFHAHLRNCLPLRARVP